MSVLNHALRGQRVLVTGATGFIGGRLAERLATEEGAIVTGAGRRLEQANGLADAGVRLAAADLRETAIFPDLVAGQAIVFHCAAWLARHGDAADATAVNVTATEALLRAASAAGAGRFIHVSSIAAYGAPERPIYDEAQPVNAQQPLIYGRTKAAGELLVRELAGALDLPWVVVRPAQVYGPRAMEWSVGMLQLVRKRVPVVLGGGRGQVHPIYIDNLVDGLLQMAVHPAATGEAFNLAGDPITWRQFFGYYGRMSGRRLVGIPLWAGRLLAIANEKVGLGLPLTRQTIRFYEAWTRYPTDKARERLGWRPRVGLDEGMARTEAWLRQAGHLPG